MLKRIESARILAYFPTPSISHQVVFRPITQELARRGHEVVVVTTDPVFPKGKTPANLTEIDVHDISYKSWKEFLEMKQGKKDDIWLQIEVMIEKLATIFELQMQVPEVREVVDKERKYYDLLLLEACHKPVLALIHKLDIPAIQISSFGALDYHYEAMGSPIHPILYPTPIRQRLYNLSFFEKVMEYYAYLKFQRLQSKTIEYDNFIVKRIFGEEVPLVEELQHRVKMLFVNEHPIWSDNHPVPPNIVSIGGIHSRPPMELPQELKEYLDSSKNGIIYISFGTNVLPSLLPPEKIRIMTTVLSKLPYDVLWKWDKDELPGKSKNIKIAKWFPQADLLKHPKIKLFITQGGLQSTDEAINAAVPLCGIPIIGDQWYNAEKYVRHKIGKQLEIEKLTETEFEEAVKSLIEDKSYKNNILRLRSLMRDHPISPLNLSIFWIEHVIKYGGDHLEPPAAHMSWIEYYEVVIIILLMLKRIESARILAYFPTPSISHQVVFRPITQELARRGHEVVVVTTDPVFPKGKTPANLTEIDVHDISYESWKEFLEMKQGKKEDLWRQMEVAMERLATIFDLQMQVPEVKEVVDKEGKYYDLLLLEACHKSVMGLMHKLDIPAIQISSFGAFDYHYEALGSPIHPILYPAPIRQRLYNLTFIEKVMEYHAHLKFQWLQSKTTEYDNVIVKKIFGKDVPPVEELQNRVKMLFVNEHKIWSDNHPVSSNIIFIGGIHTSPSKQLPQELKEYLDSSKNGIIYVSFGTNVLPSLLPPEKIRIMTTVLSKLPYDVLWKWDKDVLPGKSKNIKIAKWFPQADLLKHPNIKLFITQGGLQSTDEAINAAVPLCGIPIIGDQWYNAEKYVRHKIGKQLEIEKLTETEFEEAVKSLIEDKSYKNNILRLRSLMRDHPISPLNLSIFWIEHVIKYGGDHLEPPAAHMGMEGARILAYFPTPSISHQVVFRPITQELARRGHEVVVVTTDPAFPKGQTLANLTEIDVHDLSYESWQEFLNIKQGNKENIWSQMKLISERFAFVFYLQMQNPKVQEIIGKDRKFYDLLLIEACQKTALGLIHKFDAPAIQLSSFGAFHFHYGALGAPIHPILYPVPARQRLYNLTLIERVMEYYAHLKIYNIFSDTMKYDNYIVKKIFGEEVPLVEELQNRVKMLFVNEHPIWSDNRPVPPNIIFMGGIQQIPTKELPKELKEYLDKSKNGVIYISFGTNVIPSLLPQEKIKIMTTVLSKLPYDVLWKWDKDELPGKSKNIKIAKWFPQPDLLKHPRVKLFITQAGLQSTDEAINAAVPVIGMPVLGDQWYNAEKYVHHKIGKQLEIAKLTAVEFEEAIKTLIEDITYKNNILKLRSLMRDYPISPLNLSVFWIEHVIKYGGDHLEPPAAHMSWIEYYEVKLILIGMDRVSSVKMSNIDRLTPGATLKRDFLSPPEVH
ncbi:unnamed protein product [Danaus chrysippus]|uniref:(African queen) hypothetical protein n=1 Tax=Danaus chrysippus TaxID=151541 RepID=A0A8J2QUR7_9NEOP|nr:unnamed protein product [Danaus chrysippus]